MKKEKQRARGAGKFPAPPLFFLYAAFAKKSGVPFTNRGTLLRYEDGAVTLETAEGPVTLERGAASKIRLLDDEDADGGNE